MAKLKNTLRTCSRGHQYYKSSDCPTCPVCEEERKPMVGFISMLSAPARRVLENAGIKTIKDLSKYTEAEVLSLHGIGKASMPVLREELQAAKLKFRGE